jgi:DivIVA domain-containing protein
MERSRIYAGDVAISFSRPDPTSPVSVRDATFPTGRRGFDQQEVRDFLALVAAELARMQERERYLDDELRSLRMRRAGPPAELGNLDDETVARLLGEETTRIVQAARESATAIRTKAEEAAERLLREAREEAQQLRDAAESDATRRRREADQDAEAELEMAKQQGREMVDEARAYRERVLTELSRRRDLARQQIDQLVHGRDRLVQAFERARLVAADVVAELAPLGELSEYVNLSPTTGPVPVMVPASRLAELSSISDETLALRATSDPDDPALDPNGSSVADADVPEVEEPAGGDDTAGPEGTAVSGSTETVDTTESTEPGSETARSAAGATVLQFPDRRADTVVIAPGSEAEDDTAEESDEALAEDEVDEVDEVDEDDITAADVDDLFARLRTQNEAARVEDADAESAEPAAPTPFEVRDEALTPLIVSSGRKLKRVLADEQNDVLDRLRGQPGVRSLDDLLPAVGEHAGRYFDAIASDLGAAADAGASSLGAAAGVLDLGDNTVLAPVRAALTADLIAPLRDRLAERIKAADGDNEELTKKARAIYREWKTKRIDDHLDDLLHHAYSRGAFAALAEGEPVRWTFDPAVGPCSDCEDNSLQGTVAAGTAFPTGHVCAPAHAGCRCLVVRVG